VRLTPLITVDLGLENRDGKLFAVKALGLSQKHYLVLEADTYHREEEFIGMGSTLHVEITEQAFDALRLKPWPRSQTDNIHFSVRPGVASVNPEIANALAEAAKEKP
jgi:hypothetical protein